jgi:SAM-dependent methyltransferase
MKTMTRINRRGEPFPESMSRISPFQSHTTEYEKWFTDHPGAYEAELEAIRSMLPGGGPGLEVGVGTGRFAARLGISVGIDPVAEMYSIAEKRGIRIVGARAEQLPFRNSIFSFVLMVNVVCFLDDISKAFLEARRVLKRPGYLMVAIIDRASPLGLDYAARQAESVFYRHAVFHTAECIISLMRQAGFRRITSCQTLFQPSAAIREEEPLLPGSGQGLFVVLRGKIG